MQTTTLAVQGMHCQGCVRTLQAQLMALPGVEKADVQIGQVSLQHQETLSLAEIINVIEEAGFDASVPS